MNLEKLKEVLTEIKRLEATAKVEPETMPFDARPGWEMAVNQAKAALPAARDSYRSVVESNTASIFVHGDPDKCAKIAQEGREKGTFVVDGSGLYRDIANKIWLQLGETKRLLPDFVRQIEQLAIDYGQDNRMPANWIRVDTADYNVELRDFDHLVQIVRNTIRTSTPGYVQPVGDVFAAWYARQDFFAQCEALSWNELPVAVTVTNLTQPELQGFQELFAPGRPFSVIDANDTKSVEKAVAGASRDLAKKLGVSGKDPAESLATGVNKQPANKESK